MMNTLSHSVGERLPARKKEWNPPKWMYPIIYNKWKIVFAFLAVVLTVCLLGVGFAADVPYKDRMLGFGIDAMIKGIFGPNGEVESWITVTGQLKLGAFSDSSAGMVSSTVNSIYNVFSSVGMVFMLMFWGIGYFDMIMAQNNQMFLEQIVKKLILLIIGMVVIVNAKEIVLFFISVGNAIWNATGFSSSSGLDYTNANAVGKMIKDELNENSGIFASFAVSLKYVVQMLAPWLISIVANWGIKIFALARYLEICIVTAVSPLLFCDISNAHGGFTHSAAFRGMRQVMALAIQGIVILAGLQLCTAISGEIISPSTTITTANFLDVGFAMVAISLAKLGITAKSQQIARQLVGLG